jgi:hypothetical protein
MGESYIICEINVDYLEDVAKFNTLNSSIFILLKYGKLWCTFAIFFMFAIKVVKCSVRCSFHRGLRRINGCIELFFMIGLVVGCGSGFKDNDAETGESIATETAILDSSCGLRVDEKIVKLGFNLVLDTTGATQPPQGLAKPRLKV